MNSGNKEEVKSFLRTTGGREYTVLCSLAVICLFWRGLSSFIHFKWFLNVLLLRLSVRGLLYAAICWVMIWLVPAKLLKLKLKLLFFYLLLKTSCLPRSPWSGSVWSMSCGYPKAQQGFQPGPHSHTESETHTTKLYMLTLSQDCVNLTQTHTLYLMLFFWKPGFILCLIGT